MLTREELKKKLSANFRRYDFTVYPMPYESFLLYMTEYIYAFAQTYKLDWEDISWETIISADDAICAGYEKYGKALMDNEANAYLEPELYKAVEE